MGKQVFSCPPNKHIWWKLLAKTWLLTVEDKNLMKKVKDISVTMQKFWGLYVQLNVLQSNNSHGGMYLSFLKGIVYTLVKLYKEIQAACLQMLDLFHIF